MIHALNRVLHEAKSAPRPHNLIKKLHDPDPETEKKYSLFREPILEIARPVSDNKPHREETLMNSASSTIVIYIGIFIFCIYIYHIILYMYVYI